MNKKRLVIADDDPEIVNALTIRCRKLGLKVERASDGFEAGFSLFLQGDPRDRPDLVILDIEMPVDDGLSLCEEIAREESMRTTPVIILTGRSDRATIQRCKELGVHYVGKSDNVWERLEPLIVELLELEPA